MNISLNSLDDLLDDYRDEEHSQTATAQQEPLSVTDKQEIDRTDTLSKFSPASFSDFLLKPELMRAIIGCGFERPSEVQQACIPASILGMDVLCQAKSGMGKTAVYVLSVLQQLDPADGVVSVLVLCHTRELAVQIKNAFDNFSRCFPNIKTQAFFGGIPLDHDIEILRDKMRCPNIVVGTVGRTLDLIRKHHLNLGRLKHLVIDECDHLFTHPDSRRDTQEIYFAAPKDKQVLMFSATLPVYLRDECKKLMHNPLEVYVDNHALTLDGLQQFYINVSDEGKIRLLFRLLDNISFNQVCIFVKTVERAQDLDRLMVLCNFPNICIHAQLTQEERIARYQSFKNFEKRIMVATDLFGRGIDIERVNLVVNFDMAETPEQYLHRAGRAGRFGTRGVCISFLADSKDGQLMEKVKTRFQVDAQPLTKDTDINSYLA